MVMAKHADRLAFGEPASGGKSAPLSFRQRRAGSGSNPSPTTIFTKARTVQEKPHVWGFLLVGARVGMTP